MWQNIWSKKGLDSADFDIASLMKADGFDTSGAALNAESWVEFFKYVAKMARCGKGKKRVLEVGCGSGAALKSLCSINPHLEIYGIDYSQNLVDIAKCAIKEGRFICDEAKNIDLAFGDLRDLANVGDSAFGDLQDLADSSSLRTSEASVASVRSTDPYLQIQTKIIDCHDSASAESRNDEADSVCKDSANVADSAICNGGGGI